MTYPIVDNLREERGMIASPEDCLKAAAIIEEFAAALEPLAECGFEEEAQDEWHVYPTTLKIRDLRRAHEALRKLKGEMPLTEGA